jgi:hypothetical protein
MLLSRLTRASLRVLKPVLILQPGLDRKPRDSPWWSGDGHHGNDHRTRLGRRTGAGLPAPAPRFARAEMRARSRRFLRGLLSGAARKNGRQLAEAAGERSPHGMQEFLNRAVWDADAVRDDLRAAPPRWQAGSRSAASGTKMTPLGKSSATAAAALSARRVLPTPRGRAPFGVTRPRTLADFS